MLGLDPVETAVSPQTIQPHPFTGTGLQLYVGRFPTHFEFLHGAKVYRKRPFFPAKFYPLLRLALPTLEILR